MSYVSALCRLLLAPANFGKRARLSRKRELNCSSVLEDIFTWLQCSRGFRLFRSFGPCGARLSASLFSRVGGQHSQRRLRRSKIGECINFIRCSAPATATRFALRLHS